MAGLDLLTRSELDRYRELIPDDEDCQDKWEAAIGDPEKYVSLLVGQIDDDEQRAGLDKENYHDLSEWERTTKSYFLAYHEVKVHLKWVLSRPAEAEAYTRFQVSDCLRSISLSGTCRSSIYSLDVVQLAGGGGQSPRLSFRVWSIWGNVRHQASQSCGEQGRGG